MRIDLTPDVEEALEEAARARGTTPQSLVVGMIRKRLLSSTNNGSAAAPRTLAERLVGHVGVLHSSEYVPGGAQLSENSRETFADLLLEKRRDERL